MADTKTGVLALPGRCRPTRQASGSQTGRKTVVGDPYLSLQLWNFAAEAPRSWQPLVELACAADRAGIGKVVVSDHVAFGEALDAYSDPRLGGTAGGRQPTGPDGHWLEPLTVLSVIAGRTSSVRLGTGILLAALRRPTVLAKTLATLDVLSDGRLDIGVGVGWQREEYEACGLEFDNRGRLLDHTLEVCETLWSRQRASYASSELAFDHIHSSPKPVQRPQDSSGGRAGLPIWVSGTVNPAAMRRLARFGSGWIPWGPAVGSVSAIADMRSAVAAQGRDPDEIAVQGVLPLKRTDDGVDLDASMAGLDPLLEAGVVDFRAYLPVPTDPGEAADYLADAVERFNAATR